MRCSKRGCDKPATTRGMCESDYRRTVRMRINGYRDAAPTRAHIAALRQLGWTYEQIAETAGLSTWVVHKAGIGETRRVLADSEKAILAVPLRPRASHRGIDSTGTRRRVQALAWLGWSGKDVAARVGMPVSSLRTLILPTRQISYALAQRVAAIFDELSATPGPSVIAAAKARQLGFIPPAAWDDDIDNPKARPRGMRRMLAHADAVGQGKTS